MDEMEVDIGAPGDLTIVQEDDEGRSSSLSGESNEEPKEQEDDGDGEYQGDDEPTHLIHEPEEEPAPCE
jgi:hypothetical protein